MAANPVVSREKWLEARKALLAKEKAFTRERDALSAARRDLPWVKIEKPYTFQTERGEESLADLFGSCSQLLVYHFMFGPEWEEGCPSCSYLADGYDHLPIHMRHRDISFITVSRAPLEKIEAYKNRLGWSFDWVSSNGSDFNADFHVSFSAEELQGDIYYNYHMTTFPADEAPGISAFIKNDAGEIFHTYSSYSRGLDALIGAYQFIDLAPKGRDEDTLDWTMQWLRRRDQYED
ncbi:MAG: thioredoxin family protein [Pseudomonadota bacterium]